MTAPAAMSSDRPITFAIATNATPSVPAVVHELPVTMPPTARRMKIAPTAEVTPPTAASATAATVKPFLNAIRLAKAALRRSATCNGPSVALMPKSQIVSAIRRIKTTTGSTASSRLGSLGPFVTSTPVLMGDGLRRGRSARGGLRGPAREQQPAALGDRDDREPDHDAEDPLADVQVLGVEDPLEDPELRPEEDRGKRPRAAHQEHLVLEHVEREDRAVLVAAAEREEEVAERKRGQAHRAGELARVVMVVGPGDQEKCRAAHHEP